MKILVTGATGFLGSRTIEKLATYPEVEKIIAAGRTKKAIHEVKHAKIEYRLGDLTDSKYVESIVKSVDYVVNCASLSSPFGDYTDFKKANVDTQKLLIRYSEAIGIKRFVYISSPSVYNNYSDRFLVKESDVLPNPLINNYAVTKIEAEKLLQKSSLSHVIIRPRALIGRGDTVIMPRLIRAHKAGRLRLIGDGKNRIDLTSVSNVVDSIWLGLTTNKVNCGTIYNIANGEPLLIWNKIRYVLKELDLELSDKKLSYSAAMRIASVLEFIAKFTKKEPTLMRYSVSTLANSLTIDITKAKEKLGYEPKMSTDEAIEEFLDWFKTIDY
ncbi:MAG: NAD-dependent epimerase/dehydratase family protein [Saprospiraceae bacterium]